MAKTKRVGKAASKPLPSYTEKTFAEALLTYMGFPITAANVGSIMAWEAREGGHFHNTAHYNPLNTTLSMPGATSMNSVGVKAYTSAQQGIEATAKTLLGGYPTIVADLKAGIGIRANAQGDINKWVTGSRSGHTYSYPFAIAKGPFSKVSFGGGANPITAVGNAAGAVGGGIEAGAKAGYNAFNNLLKGPEAMYHAFAWPFGNGGIDNQKNALRVVEVVGGGVLLGMGLVALMREAGMKPPEVMGKYLPQLPSERVHIGGGVESTIKTGWFKRKESATHKPIPGYVVPKGSRIIETDIP